MRHRASSLGILLFFGAACSELIGLGDYEEVNLVPGNGGAGGTGSGGRDGSAGSVRGGSAGSGNSPSSGGGGAVSGGGFGTAGEAGAAGAAGNPTEGGTAGAPSVTGGGPADAGSGGEAATTGGTASFGGAGGGTGLGGSTGGTGGALGGTGQGGTTGGASQGGTTGGTGKGGTTGGTSQGGAGGKGGTVATSGAAGKGGAGGVAGAGGKAGGPSCTEQQLLIDGAFDQQNAIWEQSSDLDFEIIASKSDIGFTPHSGQRVAWFGGVCPEDGDPCEDQEYLSQTLSVPIGTTELRASCFWQIQTFESGIQGFDYVEVRLLSANAAPFSFARFSNLNPSDTWQSFTTETPTTPLYAGQTVTFEIHASLDDSLDTSFWFDTCSLVATVCQ